ncbi:MAG: pyruvate formate-lyase-activating protein [Defluviitaleaceae bacterium]|nr:pyruvate formate-lyase-activating protein [Defluviitaleaceae bacterium]
MQGFVHSIETGGMTDGPGIRYVVFLSGCPLRCLYCHNPDTWNMGSGEPTTVSELIKDVKKYKNFHKVSGGGLTISGGEPLLQSKFLLELLKAAKAEGIHTALDTSGYAKPEIVAEILDYTDLILLDIKSINPKIYSDLTGVEISPTLNTLEQARKKGVDVWIRYVLVPGITDNTEDIQALADHLRPYPNIKRIQVLPFHKMGEHKWEALGLGYKLHQTQPPTEKSLQSTRKTLLNAD